MPLSIFELKDTSICCCFTGHRPEKLGCSEDYVSAALMRETIAAMLAGCTTFITGMSKGVDIIAGELVASVKKTEKDVKLVCAIPFKGFALRWPREWRERYESVLAAADLTYCLFDKYIAYAYDTRNRWMVDHSARLIAAYSGEPGGTRSTIAYARSRGVEVRLIELPNGG